MIASETLAPNPKYSRLYVIPSATFRLPLSGLLRRSAPSSLRSPTVRVCSLEESCSSIRIFWQVVRPIRVFSFVSVDPYFFKPRMWGKDVTLEAVASNQRIVFVNPFSFFTICCKAVIFCAIICIWSSFLFKFWGLICLMDLCNWGFCDHGCSLWDGYVRWYVTNDRDVCLLCGHFSSYVELFLLLLYVDLVFCVA